MGVLLKFGLLGSVSAGLRFGTATDLWAGFYSSAALLGVPCIAQVEACRVTCGEVYVS